MAQRGWRTGLKKVNGIWVNNDGTPYVKKTTRDYTPRSPQTITPTPPPPPNTLNLNEIKQKLEIDDSIPQQNPSSNGLNPSRPPPIDVEVATSLIATPFELVASMTKIEDVKLSREEKENLGRLTKVVLDHYAPAFINKHGDLIAFSGVFLFTVLNKTNLVLKVLDERKKENERRKAEPTPNGASPNTTTEHRLDELPKAN